MPATVVIGAQWGDEGKAKVIDWLVAYQPQFKTLIRYQGGCNAGHTVVKGDKTYKFHLIPSGILNPKMLCIIGPGTVILPEVLEKELKALEEEGISLANLKISERAHLTLPYHLQLDQKKEQSLGDAKIGTTGRGIGPTYEDKVSRMGLRVGDLLLPEATLKNRLECILDQKNPLLTQYYQLPKTQLEDLMAWAQQYKARLLPFICNTDQLLYESLKNDEDLLLEGAQGTMLDLDMGTYPFVTSSNPVAGGAYVGAGIPPKSIDRVIGISKCYTTRVGEGPFPTELFGEEADELRSIGHEFGTTTGRPRRCGWLDLVALKYAVQVNGLDALAITKLDILSQLKQVKVCIAYQNTQTGEITKQFPSRLDAFEHLKPVYETVEGWPDLDTTITNAQALPASLMACLKLIEAEVGVPAMIASIGADRDETVLLNSMVLNSNTMLSCAAS